MDLPAIYSFFITPQKGMVLWAYIFSALLAGILGLFLLTRVPKKARKPIVAAVTFAAGLYLSLEFLIPHDNIFTAAMPKVANFQLVTGCFTVLLGLGSLFLIQGKKVMFGSSERINGIGFFAGFFGILISGFLMDAGVKGCEEIFDIFFSGLYVSMQAAMFSLVAFYIVSASYRAFRIKSVETGLLLLSTAIIMLAVIPLGSVITDFLPKSGVLSVFRVEKLGYWLLTSPNMAVQRAIAFGVAVGSMATCLRIWLSLEKGSFYDKEL
ncbi:MAG: hypothetical protein J5758_04180 [Abditibacteriota bacterium]|nr:hypothetical protein [Abditibacteriota bacterium]